MKNKQRLDVLIVFGYGPVLPRTAPEGGKLNLYGRINAIAAGILFENYDVRAIIPTGGRTGGQTRPSEAALIAGILRKKFGVPERLIRLEEQSTDTLFNVAHVANLLDRSHEASGKLGFVAMGFHLPRICEICSLAHLDGEFISAEEAVSKSLARYERLLCKLLCPEEESFARMIEDQRRAFRGLREMPEYWLPPMLAIENPARLRQILRAERIQPFLQSHGIDPEKDSVDRLREWLSSIQRQFPA